jgi:rhamnulokinase
MERAFRIVPRHEIFERTGIQFLPFNSLYQLMSLVLSGSPLPARAQTFLTIPDLFNYWLTGVAVCEFTNATTTQMYDPRAGDWARGMLGALSVPTHFLPAVVRPGEPLGNLLPSLASEVGTEPTLVVAPACHDTASAVAAVPAREEGYAYISSGTWSLVGVEERQPLITAQALSGNFTNEGGTRGFLLLKNVQGLWLLQECRRAWAEEGEAPSYSDLTRLAEASAPFAALIDPDDASFLSPANMPRAIQAFCARTGQRPPQTHGETVRAILESLALKYRWVIERIATMRKRPVGPIHVVGGGALNRPLCQFTADATGRLVLAGPAEATAVGNILAQAVALRHLGSLEEGRELVRRSFEVTPYEPRASAPWDEAYERFRALLQAVSEPESS